MTQRYLHPARTMPFLDLFEGLERYRSIGLVRRVFDQETGRALYHYTDKCVKERKWNDITRLANGLIIHRDYQMVVATPFPKFFNIQENVTDIPDLPFETFERHDGALVIIHHFGNGPFYNNNIWRSAAKTGFITGGISEDTTGLIPGITYLVQEVDLNLILLAAYQKDGTELTYQELSDVATKFGASVPLLYNYSTVAEVLEAAKTLPGTSKGFVVRFLDGTRLKIKS